MLNILEKIMKKETGGPAFPVFPETGAGHSAAFKGMTLRDYFAAKALPAIIGSWVKDLMLHEGIDFDGLHLHDNVGGSPDSIALEAYGMADAMLRVKMGIDV